MTEKIISVSLEDDNTVKTVKEIYEPRYEGICNYSQCECELIAEDFKNMNKVWITKHNREGFDSLDTGEDWQPEGVSVCADVESFQKYLDETYGKGKYEAYALGVYVHSAVSFAFNKGEDNRCRWDSGTCGFVGITKQLNIDLNEYASRLSDAWNGYVHIFQVWDNLEDEVVDEIVSIESTKSINEWKDKMKEKYGIEKYEEQH